MRIIGFLLLALSRLAALLSGGGRRLAADDASFRPIPPRRLDCSFRPILRLTPAADDGRPCWICGEQKDGHTHDDQ